MSDKMKVEQRGLTPRQRKELFDRISSTEDLQELEVEIGDDLEPAESEEEREE